MVFCINRLYTFLSTTQALLTMQKRNATQEETNSRLLKKQRAILSTKRRLRTEANKRLDYVRSIFVSTSNELLDSVALHIDCVGIIWDYAAMHCRFKQEWERVVARSTMLQTAQNIREQEKVDKKEPSDDVCTLRKCWWCIQSSLDINTLLVLGGFDLFVCIDHQLDTTRRILGGGRSLVELLTPQLFLHEKGDLKEAVLLLSIFEGNVQVKILIALFEVSSVHARFQLLLDNVISHVLAHLAEWPHESRQFKVFLSILFQSRYGDNMREQLILQLPVEFIQKCAFWLRCAVLKDERGIAVIRKHSGGKNFYAWAADQVMNEWFDNC